MGTATQKRKAFSTKSRHRKAAYYRRRAIPLAVQGRFER
jgi:hypothetical protein